MEGIKIIDNFLTKTQHKIILDSMLARTFPWYYLDHANDFSSDDTGCNFYFKHNFLLPNGQEYNSHYIKLIDPILKKLEKYN